MVTNINFGKVVHRPYWKVTEDSLTNSHNFLYATLREIFKGNNEELVFHLRLPSIVPMCNYSDLKALLSTSFYLRPYKNMLQNKNKTYSYHLPYRYFYLDTQIDNLIIYLNKLELITSFMGLTNFHCVMHLNGSSIDSIMYNLVKLRERISETMWKNICFENCDIGLNVEKTLLLSLVFNRPFIYDNYHNKINRNRFLDFNIMNDISKSWKSTTLIPKIHLSNGNGSKKHSNKLPEIETINNILENYNRISKNLIVLIELKESTKCLTQLRESLTNCMWLTDFSCFYTV